MIPKIRPRWWCSFFRQILTTGIYTSVVFWFWPVIKPPFPASFLKWQFCGLPYVSVAVHTSAKCPWHYMLHNSSIQTVEEVHSTMHPTGLNLWSPRLVGDHHGFLHTTSIDYFSQMEMKGTWAEISTSGQNLSQIPCTDPESTHTLFVKYAQFVMFSRFIPTVILKFLFYIQLLGWNRVCFSAWN